MFDLLERIGTLTEHLDKIVVMFHEAEKLGPLDQLWHDVVTEWIEHQITEYFVLLRGVLLFHKGTQHLLHLDP